MNTINTWQQGHFIRKNHNSSWEEVRSEEESLLVRPSPTGTAICRCNKPEDAKWIASRLNLAADLERKMKSKKKRDLKWK